MVQSGHPSQTFDCLYCLTYDFDDITEVTETCCNTKEVVGPDSNHKQSPTAAQQQPRAMLLCQSRSQSKSSQSFVLFPPLFKQHYLKTVTIYPTNPTKSRLQN